MTDETKQVTLQLTNEEIVSVIHACGVTGYLLGQYMGEVGKSSDPLAPMYVDRAVAQREALLKFLNKFQMSMMDRDEGTILQ